MEMGPSDGRNYCPAQRRCCTPGMCTENSPAVAIQAMGTGPKGPSHPTAHPNTVLLTPCFVCHWGQAPCSRACVLGSSLQGTEPTGDTQRMGTVSKREITKIEMGFFTLPRARYPMKNAICCGRRALCFSYTPARARGFQQVLPEEPPSLWQPGAPLCWALVQCPAQQSLNDG